ncbi:S1C family serine protease [Xylanimonas ulmi]|uniref:Putative serine protease PepD n=1 Tax=Xylanimonas ulmi TaxID=228973 RepID=A0A4Q7M5W9_9MICO|nr:trypsin-like peptidase domain-containing protein [Xylanibacterium ulmi]RZS63054.1 putative serine protease PepD [Xylanibacterium ulmi]
MSIENHDQPAVPEGSDPGATPQVPEQTPAEQTSAPERGDAAQGAPAAPAQPTPHPQTQQTQELHPQQHPTTPYPQQAPARPQPQYGQYAPGHQSPAPQPPYGANPYGQAPYPQAAQHQPAQPQRRAPYPQQQGTQQQGPQQQGPQQQGTQPGASFSNPYLATPSSSEPSAPQRERKPRVWAPVISAAAIAALLASGGTAALMHGLSDNSTPTSIAELGNPGRVDSAPVKDSTATNPDWQAVTAAVSPSVVAIQVASTQGGAEGSGLILDDDGHILTNNHVVSGAQNNIVQVTLSDGRIFQAKIVGTDATTDLAVVVLQDPPSNLTPVALGDSDAVQVGDPVLAVGNPLGLANTATTGIVSALDRPVTASGEGADTQVVTNAIQIDAAINPGNSGGPLFDATGRVIGITSSIATLSSGSSQSGSIGLGFAIPVNLAKNISSQLIENGSAQHAFLGVSMVDGTATADGVTRRGAQVQNVTSGSPAATAGIQAGDVIVAIGDQPVGGAESLTAFVRERQAGDQAVLTVVRGGSAQQITVTLAVRDESTQSGSGQQGDQGQVPPGFGDGSGSDGSGSDGSGSDGSGSGSGSGSDGSSSDGSSEGGNLWDWLFGGN